LGRRQTQQYFFECFIIIIVIVIIEKNIRKNTAAIDGAPKIVAHYWSLFRARQFQLIFSEVIHYIVKIFESDYSYSYIEKRLINSAGFHSWANVIEVSGSVYDVLSINAGIALCVSSKVASRKKEF
jgi:hypothetical protein